MAHGAKGGPEATPQYSQRFEDNEDPDGEQRSMSGDTFTEGGGGAR